jgi:hypothetical protein
VREALHANNADGVLRHVEWMVNRRREIHDKQVLMPMAQRDVKRQDGTRVERRPDVTEWIDAQLANDPSAKSPDLWRRAPDWLTDQIGERRFATRVTGRRKARASK